MKYLNKLFSWMGSDGMMHVILSAVITIVLGWMFPLYFTIPIALGLGIAKEVYDGGTGKGRAEWKDIVCDVIGVLIGIL